MSLCNSGTLSNATFNLAPGIPPCLPTTVSSQLYISNKDKAPTNSDYLLQYTEKNIQYLAKSFSKEGGGRIRVVDFWHILFCCTLDCYINNTDNSL